MKLIWSPCLLASLLTVVVFSPASAQDARIEIKGAGYQKSISASPPPSPSPDPSSADTNPVRGTQRSQIHVLSAEFGNQPLEAELPTEETPGAGPENPYVYATEYESKSNTPSDRKFRTTVSGFRYGSGTFRSSDIRYGVTGGSRNRLRYGAGMRRASDIRYGVTEGSKNNIQYGSGERRPGIRYGVTGSTRNGIRYGSEAQDP